MTQSALMNEWWTTPIFWVLVVVIGLCAFLLIRQLIKDKRNEMGFFVDEDGGLVTDTTEEADALNEAITAAVSDLIAHYSMWCDVPAEEMQIKTHVMGATTVIQALFGNTEICTSFDWWRRKLKIIYIYCDPEERIFIQKTKTFKMRGNLVPKIKVCEFIQRLNEKVYHAYFETPEALLGDLMACAEKFAVEKDDAFYQDILMWAALKAYSVYYRRKPLTGADLETLMARLLTYVYKYYPTQFLQYLQEKGHVEIIKQDETSSPDHE